jgi:hypothetical protein
MGVSSVNVGIARLHQQRVPHRSGHHPDKANDLISLSYEFFEYVINQKK